MPAFAVYHISKGMFIQHTSTLSESGIAVIITVDGIKIAGEIHFQTKDGKLTEWTTVFVSFMATAIVNGPHPLANIHEATGRLLQNKRAIDSILVDAWINDLFPYPGE